MLSTPESVQAAEQYLSKIIDMPVVFYSYDLAQIYIKKENERKRRYREISLDSLLRYIRGH
jgi:hypothetical protein